MPKHVQHDIVSVQIYAHDCGVRGVIFFSPKAKLCQGNLSTWKAAVHREVCRVDNISQSGKQRPVNGLNAGGLQAFESVAGFFQSIRSSIASSLLRFLDLARSTVKSLNNEKRLVGRKKHRRKKSIYAAGVQKLAEPERAGFAARKFRDRMAVPVIDVRKDTATKFFQDIAKRYGASSCSKILYLQARKVASCARICFRLFPVSW